MSQSSCVTPDGPAWFCLQSQPKHEHIAATHLRQIPGVEAFCPRMRFKRLTARGPVSVTEALFPGYLFAHFEFQSMHRQVRYAPSVVKILQFGKIFAVVDGAVIADLRARTGMEEIIVVGAQVNPGDEVRIVEGVFRGLEAVVTQILPARERVKVLMEFLGRTMEAEVKKPALLSKVRHPLAAV